MRASISEGSCKELFWLEPGRHRWLTSCSSRSFLDLQPQRVIYRILSSQFALNQSSPSFLELITTGTSQSLWKKILSCSFQVCGKPHGCRLLFFFLHMEPWKILSLPLHPPLHFQVLALCTKHGSLGSCPGTPADGSASSWEACGPSWQGRPMAWSVWVPQTLQMLPAHQHLPLNTRG